MKRIFLFMTIAFAGVAHAAGVMGPQALRTHYAAIAPRLAASEFGAPLLLQSEATPGRIDGEVFAIVDQPFAAVSAALAEPAAWCEILMLHLNKKSCRRVTDASGTTLRVRVGKKEPQPADQASLLVFRWLGATRRADHVVVQLQADEGPYDTSDYRFFTEAVPIDGNRTFLHMGYAFGFGGAGSVAMKIYVATVGRGKIGFTHEGGKYVGGVRGIAERNTMRYYLAIEAYVASLSLPREQQLEKRITQWFDATERYPRQLHEVERDDYLKMKREELKRPQK
jgi:hypothetical protein